MSKELVDFLHYIEDTSDERALQSGSERIQKIHKRVRNVKLSEETGVKYMQAWEEKYYEREEGREEGEILKLITLVQKKVLKEKSMAVIADELEESIEIIKPIYELVVKNPSADRLDIFEMLK